jgi:hypothetical protein
MGLYPQSLMKSTSTPDTFDIPMNKNDNICSEINESEGADFKDL